MEPETNKIILTYLNGTGYIFNAEDYMSVRRKHRIVGSTVGISCSRGWSGNSPSLPVELTIHETRLLLENDVAVLVSKSENLLRVPTQIEVDLCKTEFEEKLKVQEDHLRNGKVKESLQYIDKIMYGKRKKLLNSGVLEKDINLTQEKVLQEIREGIQYDRNNALVEIHCEHPRAHESTVVKLPVNDTLKYRVFKDFWKRGKYVTCGEAFGADFIVYPGDPIVFHASHIIIILKKPIVNPLLLIAKVRLAVIVNKFCVFAYLDVNNELSYQTVQWEGNKEGIKLSYFFLFYLRNEH